MPKTDKRLVDACVTEVGRHTDELAEQDRRLAALEAHITDLEDRLNDRGVFTGDGVCTVPGNPAHVWEDNRA